MKKENFIVGKWYKRDTGSYVKLKEIKDGVFVSNEEMLKRDDFKHKITDSWHGHIVHPSNTYTLVDISEIAYLLPKDHPDLQNIERSYELW